MDWRVQPFSPPFGEIDVLARLRELTQQPQDIETALRDSRHAEEMRELEQGILADALFQSEQEAIAHASVLCPNLHSLRFQVYSIGYIRAGESEVCCQDERSSDDAASRNRNNGARKAATPLFCFMVAQANTFGEECGRHYITKSVKT